MSALVGLAWRAAVVFLVIAGLSPTSTARLGSDPHPTSDYIDAVARIVQQQHADDTVAISDARSVVLEHGRRTTWAVVLLHGFGNSPEQFHVLAESLYAHGDNVWIPRLPHHAERSGAAMLSRLTAEDIRNGTDAAIDIAVGLGDSVIVLGFSTGGVAAAWVAQYRADVRRVVIVSPALALAHVPIPLGRPLLNAALRLPNISHGLVRDTMRADRELGWSTHAVAQVIRLGLAVQRGAERTGPAVGDVAIMLNAHDHTINPDPAVALAKRWSEVGADVAVYQLTDSLQLPHDLIDTSEPGGRPAMVYQAIGALVRGEAPPSWVRRVRMER